MTDDWIAVHQQTGERMHGSWDQLCDLDKRIWTMVEDDDALAFAMVHAFGMEEDVRDGTIDWSMFYPVILPLAILEVVIYRWLSSYTKTIPIYHQSELATLYV